MKKIAAVLLLFVLCGALGALGRGEQDGTRARRVEVSGTVRLVGSMPLPSLVITGEEREWYIDDNEKDKLMHLQHQMVTVRAKEHYSDLVFGNGMSAGRRYFLKDITVISPRRI